MTSPERQVRLTLAYDGTGYAGFQRQVRGLSVQQVVEEAVARVTGETVRLTGAGRTDAGVHARGQVATFRTASRLAPERLLAALNAHLPADIRIMAAALAPPDFHPQYAARRKVYSYTIDNGPVASPLERLYAYHWRRPLDLDRMRQAAALLLGPHDFAAFRSTGGAAKTSVRTLFRCDLWERPPFLRLEVEGDGFLYNMVRIIAGTLLEVGAGGRSLDDVREALTRGDRRRAGRTLPAHGLCLERVIYE